MFNVVRSPDGYMVRAGVFPVTGDKLNQSDADIIAEFLNEVMVGHLPKHDHVKITITITSKLQDTFQFGDGLSETVPSEA